MRTLKSLRRIWGLRSSDWRVRLECAMALLPEENARAQQTLLDLLYQGPMERRVEALRSLASAATHAWSVGRLADLLCDPNPRIWKAAGEELQRVGRAAAQPLGDWFKDWRARSVPIQSSSNGFSPSSISVEPLFAGILHAQSPSSALERAVPILDSLGWQPGDPIELSVYWIVAGQPDAAAALGTVAAAPLIHLLSHCADSTASSLEHALESIGPAAKEQVFASLRDRIHRRRESLLKVLGSWLAQHDDPRVRAVIEELIHSAEESSALRREATLTLQRLGREADHGATGPNP